MRAVDTNVLARFVLDDDEKQSKLASAILREPVWVSDTVWIELGWVLHKRLGLDRALTGEALSIVLALDTVHTPDRAGVAWAVQRFHAGADWADMIHLVATRDRAASFASFDQALGRQAGDHSPVPVELLT